MLTLFLQAYKKKVEFHVTVTKDYPLLWQSVILLSLCLGTTGNHRGNDSPHSQQKHRINYQGHLASKTF